MKVKPVLEKWVRFHNTLVGWVFDHGQIPNGTHVQTGPIRTDSNGMEMIDFSNMEIHCADGMYRLGEPGTVADHDGPTYLGDIWKPSLFNVSKKLLVNSVKGFL